MIKLFFFFFFICLFDTWSLRKFMIFFLWFIIYYYYLDKRTRVKLVSSFSLYDWVRCQGSWIYIGITGILASGCLEETYKHMFCGVLLLLLFCIVFIGVNLFLETDDEVWWKLPIVAVPLIYFSRIISGTESCWNEWAYYMEMPALEEFRIHKRVKTFTCCSYVNWQPFISKDPYSL